MAHFHFGPLAPDLGQVLDILEVDFGSFLEHLTGTNYVGFCFACSSALFVELGEGDIQAVEIRRGPTRGNGRECAGVRLGDLQERARKP